MPRQQQACRRSSRSPTVEARGAGARPAGQGPGRWVSSRTSTSASAPSARQTAACARFAASPPPPGQGLSSRLPLVASTLPRDQEDSNFGGETVPPHCCCVKNHAGFWLEVVMGLHCYKIHPCLGWLLVSRFL
ncbi:hypothetical protein BDA96_01G225900 [Sorghum bicolor]|uniref:Uncharacterized protein n=2 Tax=Sorghum bicolor TaxID=4558 RepID=A0A921UY33_SORBI|nr:hypothetical protein BDA96_01G225900 [Sorghum bicolor]OQU91596.1 hypothetical protein SORBI_3001G211750 [Sorghum bicolor]